MKVNLANLYDKTVARRERWKDNLLTACNQQLSNRIKENLILDDNRIVVPLVMLECPEVERDLDVLKGLSSIMKNPINDVLKGYEMYCTSVRIHPEFDKKVRIGFEYKLTMSGKWHIFKRKLNNKFHTWWKQ